MSPEISGYFRQNRWMFEPLSEKDFNAQLTHRVIKLREERDWTQKQMAKALGVEHENYKKYEQRQSFPAFLIPRIATLSGWPLDYIINGELRRKRTGTEG